MDKALEMGKISAVGSLHLWIGVVASNVIMAIGAIILARLLLPSEYGLYSVALIPSLTINLFRDWGVNSAMTKYVAQFKSERRIEETRSIIASGIIFEIGTGLILSLLSFLFANLIASHLLLRPESTALVSVVSVTIFSGALITASQSVFIGFERMELNSLAMICQAIAKTLVSTILVFLGYGVLGAVLGYTLSFLAAGIISLALLHFFLFKNLKKAAKPRRYEVSKTLKTMLYYGVPFSISFILGGFLIQFYSFMMAFFCSDVMIGNLQAATNFAVILTFVSFPITTVLFPAFAKLDPQNEHQLLKTVFASSVKYTAMLLVPSTVAVMVLAKPLIGTLFGEEWVYAPLLLTLYVIGNLFAGFGSLSLPNILAGIGETKMLMKLSLLTLLIGIPLAFVFIPWLGIVGVVVGKIIAGLPSLFWGLHWLWKRYQARTDFISSIKIFTASIIAAMITHLSLNFLNTSDWIRLAFGGIIFLMVYIFAAPILGAITQKDIINLRTMFSGLGFISKLMDLPLFVAERTAKINFIKKD